MSFNIIEFIVKYFYYVFIGLIFLNVVIGFRSRGKAVFKKRRAILIYAILSFALFLYAMLLQKYNLGDLYLLIFLAIFIPVLYILRNILILPFSFKCKDCGKRLSFNNFFYSDSNQCDDCKSREDDKGKPKEKS